MARALATDSRSDATYLVEAHAPVLNSRRRKVLIASARAAADAMEGDGIAIRYRSAIFVPEDETCFYVFVGPSAEVVREATERAGLLPLRVTRVLS